MRIGSFFSYSAKYSITKFIYRKFGTLDLHSQIRLKPVFAYLNNALSNSNKLSLLEIGCGSGVVPFTLLENELKFDYLGIDKNSKSIDDGNNILDNYTEHSINFKCCDVEQSNQISFDGFDILLLIDIIEHLANPEKFLTKILNNLVTQPVIVVSVPTPLYPKIFGREFHLKVGHMIDGYTIKALDNLFGKFHYERDCLNYNTGLISNLFCGISYRLLTKHRITTFIKSILLYFGKYLDIYNNRRVSCSIFAIYKAKNYDNKTV